MSTAMFPNMITQQTNRSKSQTDAQKFAEFKAKKLAEKEAAKEKLAAEFPLLFGKDAKARSTVGKYANKPAPPPTSTATTPGKGKKPLSTATTPSKQVAAEVKRTPGRTTANKGNLPSKKGSVSTTNTVVNNENKDSNILHQQQQQQNGKGLTKKSSSKGFFQYFQSSKSTKEDSTSLSSSTAVVNNNDQSDVPQITVPPLTSLSRTCSIDKEDENDDDYSNAIELSIMNENHFLSTIASTHNSLLHSENLLDIIESGTTTLDSVSQDDSLHPHIDLPNEYEEDRVSSSNPQQPCLEVLSVKEKIQDALDFMLESNELDSKTYRRLSGQRFSTDALRRFSSSVAPLPRVSSSKRLSISNHIDFRVISQDLNDNEEVIETEKDSNSDSDTDCDDDDDHAMDAVILTNPFPTPSKQRERISIEEWRLSTASLHPQSGEKPGISSLPVTPQPVEAVNPTVSKDEAVSIEAVVETPVLASTEAVPPTGNINDNDIGDLEVLYALRNYISTLEEFTYYNNPMRNNKIIKNHSKMKDKRVTCIIDKPLTAEEQKQAAVVGATPATEVKQEVGEVKTTSSESSSVAVDDNASTEVKQTTTVQYYPRHTLFEEIMKAGCLSGEIISFIKYENHVKYIIDFQVRSIHYCFRSRF
jgi:hypothetical protein